MRANEFTRLIESTKTVTAGSSVAEGEKIVMKNKTIHRAEKQQSHRPPEKDTLNKTGVIKADNELGVRWDKTKGRGRYGVVDPSTEYTEQFCENCGGSLAEAGKASRALCTSSKSNSDLGASQLASCKSQGLRPRENKRKYKIADKATSVKGKRIKGHEYGGPLPFNKIDKTKKG